MLSCGRTGVTLGGYVDEYVTFDMLPFDIYKSLRRNLKGESVDVKTASNGKQPLTKEGYKNIKGLSGQIWAETIRSFEQIEYYLFPKVFGLAERRLECSTIVGIVSGRQSIYGCQTKI